MGEWVWLHFPAVLRGRSPKLHWPWTGPFVVIEVLSDVTYRVHSEKPKPGCRRQRFVVHSNHLKPCQTPIQENQHEGEPNEVNRKQGNISDNEENAFGTQLLKRAKLSQENQLNVVGQLGVVD